MQDGHNQEEEQRIQALAKAEAVPLVPEVNREMENKMRRVMGEGGVVFSDEE